MSNVFSVLVKTLVLDDAAYQEWRQRPNPLVKGIGLIVVVSLIAGLVTFAVDLANKTKPVKMAEIEAAIEESFKQQRRWNPAWQNMDPKVREMIDEQTDVVLDMIADIVQIKTPLPRSATGFFEALGAFLSRVASSLAGWLFYGALVLMAVNLLGGGARLPDFLGMVSLYTIPGLLGLLGPVLCLGGFLGLVGLIWSIVIYVKAVSVVSDLDIGRSVVAVFAPIVVIFVLGLLLTVLAVAWAAIIF